jgi:hypothetical protein
MPSLINTSEIDTEFPVPGQDNDSQGFRDNFTNIKSNLDTAKTEIETLQTDTVKVNADTTFLTSGGGDPVQLINANLKSFSIFKFPLAAEDEIKTANLLTLEFDKGDYQVYQFTNDIMTLSFTNWPALGRVGKITLQLTSTREGGTEVRFAQPGIKFDSATHSNDGKVNVTSNSDPVFLEIWSWQGGNTIYVKTFGEFKSLSL